jgi:hypothetical protein
LRIMHWALCTCAGSDVRCAPLGSYAPACLKDRRKQRENACWGSDDAAQCMHKGCSSVSALGFCSLVQCPKCCSNCPSPNQKQHHSTTQLTSCEHQLANSSTR